MEAFIYRSENIPAAAEFPYSHNVEENRRIPVPEAAWLKNREKISIKKNMTLSFYTYPVSSFL